VSVGRPAASGLSPLRKFAMIRRSTARHDGTSRRGHHPPAAQLLDSDIEQLAAVLIDCVKGGASVSFMHPLARQKASDFWRRIAGDVAGGQRALLGACSTVGIVGTVQVILDQPENQPHRADVAKMLVHRRPIMHSGRMADSAAPVSIIASSLDRTPSQARCVRPIPRFDAPSRHSRFPPGSPDRRWLPASRRSVKCQHATCRFNLGTTGARTGRCAPNSLRSFWSLETAVETLRLGWRWRGFGGYVLY
jgi:hypothetical protein